MDKKKMFAVIGLGRFGSSVAMFLAEKGYDVIAVDEDESKVDEVANMVTHAVQLNAINENSMNEIGMKDVDCAIVSVGEDIAASILICSFLKEDLKIKQVIAKASSVKHGKVLSKLGVDKIIYPEQESAVRLAQTLISPTIFDVIDVSATHNLVDIKAPAGFIGKTLEEIDIRKRYDVNIIAIKRNTPIAKDNFNNDFEQELIITPSPKERILEGDILVIIGLKEHLENIDKI